jgi:hypothetical protein
MKVEVTDFRSNPRLKELMVNYYGITHEMSVSDDDLLTEYYWLVKNGNLHFLFECEKMSNYWKEGSEV